MDLGDNALTASLTNEQRDVATVLIWYGMLRVEKVVHVWGQRASGKPLYLSLNFAINLKLLSKVLKKNRGFFSILQNFIFILPDFSCSPTS